MNALALDARTPRALYAGTDGGCVFAVQPAAYRYQLNLTVVLRRY